MKLIFDEPGSDFAEELWDRAALRISGQLAYPELRAAIAAAHRGGRIDARQLRAAVRAADEMYEAVTTIALDESLAKAAGELAQRRGLRGYDAVHLASALAIDRTETVLATWDRALADAAVLEGLAVAPGTG